MRIVSCTFLLLVAGLLPSQQVLRVDGRATGLGSGASWPDAFVSLQAALAAATTGTEIWVAAGTYLPGGPGNRHATFALRDGVALFGGFAGTEGERWQREPAVHTTVLSGDLDADDPILQGPGWYHQTATYVGNCYHVVTADTVGATAVLDGFSIEAGCSVSGSPSTSGGSGLLSLQATATIVGCRFAHNYSVAGGAVFVSGGAPTFRDCTFEENLAFANHGGGLHLAACTAALVAGCRFVGNVAMENGGPNVAGGGLYIGFDAANVVVVDSRFLANRSIFRFALPSGIYPEIGGGLFNGSSGTRVERCLFVANVTQEGGGLCSFRPITVVDCVFHHNSVFSSTNGGGWGGGIAIVEYGLAGTTSTIRGCTVVNNHAADEGGGVLIAGPVTCRPTNCILRDNTDADGAVNRSQCRGQKPRWSNISGFLLVPPGEDPIDPGDFPGCFDQPPLFVAVDGPNQVAGDEDDDLRLAVGSPCIDRGDPATTAAGLDAGGVPRYLDGDLDGTQRIDCGAYEFTNVTLVVTIAQLGGGSNGVTFSLNGAAGNLAFLGLGARGNGQPLLNLGMLFLDLVGAPVVLAFGQLPAQHVVGVPHLGVELCAQALVVTPGFAGNLSQPVDLRL